LKLPALLGRAIFDYPISLLETKKAGIYDCLKYLEQAS
jgi:hypothetical protein